MSVVGFGRAGFALAIVGATVVQASNARAEEWPTDIPTAPISIGAKQQVATACAEAAAWSAENLQGGDLAVCYSATPTASWTGVVSAASTFKNAVATLAARGGSVPPGCGGTAAGDPNEVATATAAKAAAAQTAKDDEDARLTKKAAADAASAAKSIQQKAVDDIIKTGKAPPQALLDKLFELDKALTVAENALISATTIATASATAAARATTSATNAKTASMAAAQKSVDDSLTAFHAAIDTAMNFNRSPIDFEAVAQDEKRRNACLAVRERKLTALGETARKTKEKADAAAAKDARVDAHRSDVLRKAESIVSGALSGNGFVEKPGSPDKIIFSVMSALGADQRTTGTQAILTLNLGSLVKQDEKERLALPPTLRNLTLRANLPLNSTDNVPQAGSTGAPADTPSVTRFSTVIGSSVFDETDQRLVSHDVCYQTALAYRPVAAKEAADDAATDERRDYFDVCNRLAARANRLSWRAAIGFITPSGTSSGKTRAEIIGGAIVYAPSSWIYFNGFFQGILEPRRVNGYGVGISVGGNVGGSSSGVDSWGRVGLDILGIYSYTQSTSTSSSVDDIEVRITPTVRGKLLGNSIATLGIGPRFFGRDADHPDLLATFAVTYDADTLIDQVLTTSAPPK